MNPIPPHARTPSPAAATRAAQRALYAEQTPEQTPEQIVRAMPDPERRELMAQSIPSDFDLDIGV